MFHVTRKAILFTAALATWQSFDAENALAQSPPAVRVSGRSVSQHFQARLRVESVPVLRAAPSDAGRGFAPMSLETLESIRNTLQRYAAISKRGNASVALSLQVIDALSAPSQAEYRRRMKLIPVKINSLTKTEDGTGTVVNYTVRGVTKTRVIESPKRVGKANENTIFASDTRLELVAARSNPVRLGAPWDCEYTDDENNYWSGTCATQQELDDAAATAVALQDDVDEITDEQDAEWATVCANNPPLCEEPYDDDEDEVSAPWISTSDLGSMVRLTPGAGEIGRFDISLASFQSFDTKGGLRCAANSTVLQQDGVAAFQCYSSGLAYGGAIANFGLRIWKVSRMLAAFPPAAGVGFEIGGAVIGAGAVVAAAMAVHSCLTQ